MTVEVITQLVSSVAFPIAMCLIMAWYVKYMDDKHSAEMQKISEALNNNTLAVNKLCEKMNQDV